MTSIAPRRLRRKRVLIVNAFFDEYRRMTGSRHRVPRAMGPIFLASAFSPRMCEVRVYNEQYSGPLEDPGLLGWPEMLVLTGLTSSFDRMLHLAGYARALNPGVVVVAGGPPVRILADRARRYFDYALTGDVEALEGVVREVFGQDHVAAAPFPRFDLAPPAGRLAYVESSRNCNFRCSFCSLTGEKVAYKPYDIDYIRRQILTVGRKTLVFIDNNFYGNNRDFFIDRLDLLREFYTTKRIDGWAALVTGDFFRRSENLDLVREAGCLALFSGVESFDTDTVRAYNKRQNSLVPQVEMIRQCLDAGILFTYGIMLDPSSRPIRDLEAEIDFILDRPEISLPSFFTLSIPLVGTPYFEDCLARGLIYPNTRLRDLDGVTLAMRPLDPEPEAIRFVRDLPSLRGRRGKAWRHLAGFLRRYRNRLTGLQLTAEAVATALVTTNSLASSLRPARRRGPNPTWFAPTQPLDPLYKPAFPLPAQLEEYFRPTFVTDEAGRAHPHIAQRTGARFAVPASEPEETEP